MNELKNEKGAVMVEYMLIAGCITIMLAFSAMFLYKPMLQYQELVTFMLFLPIP